jgi:hypothetical protein
MPFVYYFYILKRSSVLSRGYSHHSCRLVLILLYFPPFSVALIWCQRYHTPSPEVSFVPVSDSTLINGLGRYSGGPNSTLAVINVSPGKRYRFRLVSISCDPNFVFSIVNHNMVSCLILVQIHVTEEPTLFLDDNRGGW